MRKLFIFLSALTLALFCKVVSAANSAKISHFPAMWEAHPFYFGLQLGYGSTDWSQLKAVCEGADCANVTLSAPIKAGDRGLTWGGFVGWEVQPHFAMEMNFVRFPETRITFAPYNVYVDIDKRINSDSIRSFTYAYSFVSKFMVQIAKTGIRGFANAGAALVHRHDALNNIGHIGPTFGIGLNYVFPSKVMLELGFQYYAGYGKATLRPAIDYIPFLYSIHMKLGYRI